jgi:4-hydroxy 2-oxovalerate aldolase
MEIGFRNKKNDVEDYGPTYYCAESYINSLLQGLNGQCQIAVMVTINQFDFNDFVPCCESKISMVRVLMAYHGIKNVTDKELDMKTLQDGVQQIEKLVDLGYEVCFNLGRIDKLTCDQLYTVCSVMSKTRIKYFYMADTYGSLDLEKIEKLIPMVVNFFKHDFNNSYIEIGFHAHDNCSDGTVKALYSSKFGVSILDGCALGFGRGSGNAKTELLLMKLYTDSKFIHIMDFGNRYIESYKNCKNNTSYNIIYAICAYLGCHVSYAIDIIHTYPEYDILKIYNTLIILKNMDKHMFFHNELFIQLLK